MNNTTSPSVVAELEATPPKSKDAATSTEPKDDITVMVVCSTENEGLKLLSGTEKSGATPQILEVHITLDHRLQSRLTGWLSSIQEVRQAKMKNPAVLVNVSDSAA